MATAAKTPQIVKTPGVRGGKARIDGTRICVVDVVSLHATGAGSEQILVTEEDERRWDTDGGAARRPPPENPTLEERTIPRPFLWSSKK